MSSLISSRLIVKNLPKDTTKDKLKEHFSKFGQVTDVRLVYTKSGKFRRFCFIGYSNQSSADEAVKYFNNTYIGSAKIEVGVAKMYGDATITRPWSKYSKGSSAYNKLNPKNDEQKIIKNDTSKEEKRQVKTSSNKSHLSSLLNDFYQLESDPGFVEFLEANQKRGSVSEAWSNDEKKAKFLTNKKENDEEDIKIEEKMELEEERSENHTLSDLDYLKSKTVSTFTSEGDKDTNSVTSLYTLRMRGLPFKCQESDIRTFFSPLPLAAVRLLLDDNNRSTGLAFVDFWSSEDRDEALKKNKQKIGSRYIELFVDEGEERERKKKRPWEIKEEEDEEGVEPIGESGRIFVRNLPYTTTEDDLTELFETYGQLTEMSLLVNKETGASIGLAYVTYMFPEHAVQAFTELDGRIFQGRLLHLLPSRPPNKESMGTTTKVGGASEGGVSSTSSFKTKRDEKLKSKATNNTSAWNALFLGSNAVVDSMVDQYELSKSDILDTNTNQSLAVRLALGETQLVSQTREYLENHSVKLEVFDKEITERSKNVILVKNLTFGTTATELSDLFSRHGDLSRIILPPAGISALVEYTSSSSARKAFKKLAYAEFKHLPLYLEWAPIGVIESKEITNNNDELIKKEGGEREESEISNIEDIDSKNHTTIFVKNLNFSTTDESLLEHFRSKKGKGVVSAVVSKKYNSKGQSESLSMGYGFVTFSTIDHAQKALRTKQGSELDGHKLELSISHSHTTGRYGNESDTRRSQKRPEPTTNEEREKMTKILIRNIPFEASTKELKQLFKTFGELKSIRLPKKVTAPSSHRGFGFVEYITSEDSWNAYESLSSSTHLYGRRLVLEWAETDDSVETLRNKVTRYYEGEGPVAKRRKKLAEDLLKGDNFKEGNDN